MNYLILLDNYSIFINVLDQITVHYNLSLSNILQSSAIFLFFGTMIQSPKFLKNIIQLPRCSGPATAPGLPEQVPGPTSLLVTPGTCRPPTEWKTQKE